MPASASAVLADLESLLHRALSRSGTGAWQAANEALDRAADLLPTVIAQVPADGDGLRRCFTLLGQLRTRVVSDRQLTRDELDQLRYTRRQVGSTRTAYTQRQPMAQRFGHSA